MHNIVTTSGFIVDSRPYREADKLYSIFTRELGLVRVVAQGIRLERSKLRYHVRENDIGLFSLVRGRDMWRLTNAQEEIFDLNGLHPRLNELYEGLLARISLLLRRVLHGEEANPTLFEHIESCYHFIISNPGLNNERLQTLESLVVIRALNTLGYIGNDEEVADCLQPRETSLILLDRICSKRVILNKHINKALRESHL